MTHPDYTRQKAIELRTNNQLTIDEIAECLAVSRTTVYYWVQDIPIPATAKQSAARQRASNANRAQAQARRAEAYETGSRMFFEMSCEDTFRDFVCMYIGEGFKRDRNKVSLCNSDPRVVKLAQKWITRFSVSPIRYSVQYHADQSLDDLKRFWATLLGVETEDILLQRKSNSGQLRGRKWRSRLGVLEVSTGDTQFRSRLEAWMDIVKADWQ